MVKKNIRMNVFIIIFKIKNKMITYDYWLQWDVTRFCALDCEYCFNPESKKKFTPIELDIDALLKTLLKTGKIFRIGFTGGEPLLVPNIIEAIEALQVNGHIISLNTSLLNKRVQEFSEKVDPDKTLFVHASYHYHEFKKRGMLGRFAENYRLIEEKGFNIYTEAIAYPKYVSSVDEILEYALTNGIKTKFAPYVGGYKSKGYPEKYTEGEIAAFNLDYDDIDSYSPKGEICNAGYSAAVVYSNGEIHKCFNIKERLGNIYEEINFEKNLEICQRNVCGCPLNYYDKELLMKSLRSKL